MIKAATSHFGLIKPVQSARFTLIIALLLMMQNGFAQFTATTRATGQWNANATWSTTRTGTISTVGSSTTVTGVGTNFLTELAVGDTITTTADALFGTNSRVASITNNTSLTITTAATIASQSFNARRVPGSTDDVIISGSNTITITANASCNSVTYTGNQTKSITFGANVATLNVAGAFGLNDAGNGVGYSLVVNAGTVNAASLTMVGGGNGGGTTAVTLTSGTLGITGAVSLTPNNGAQTITVGTGTFNAGSISLVGSATPASLVTATTGTINVTGNIAFSGTAAKAQLTFTGAGILNLGGNMGSGGTFTAGTSTVNMNGTTQAINGAYTYNNLTVKSTSTTTANALSTVSGTFTVENSGTFIVKASTGTDGAAGDIPGATRSFGASSTIEIQKWGDGTGTSLVALPTGVTWGNLKINVTTTMASSWNQLGNLTTINGTLTMASLGLATQREFRLTGAAALTLSVGGISVTGGTLNTNSGTAAPVINLTGNLSVTGTGVLNSTGSGLATINFSAASGTQTFSSTSGGISASQIAWKVGTGSSTNTVQLSTDFIMQSLGTMTVLTGSTLDCQAFKVAGAIAGTNGSFTLNSGGTLKIGSSAGIVASLAATTGNIQTGTVKSFSTGANYFYNGTSTQATGTGLPATIAGLTISNSGGTTGVTLTSSVSATTLTLSAGRLTTGGNTVTVSTTGGLTTGGSTNYVSGTLIRAVSGAGNVAFPIGDASNYTPISLNFGAATAGNVTVSTSVPGVPPANGFIPTGSGISQTKYINRT